jgi:hypothetical protein
VRARRCAASGEMWSTVQMVDGEVVLEPTRNATRYGRLLVRRSGEKCQFSSTQQHHVPLPPAPFTRAQRIAMRGLDQHRAAVFLSSARRGLLREPGVSVVDMLVGKIDGEFEVALNGQRKVGGRGRARVGMASRLTKRGRRGRQCERDEQGEWWRR